MLLFKFTANTTDSFMQSSEVPKSPGQENPWFMLVYPFYSWWNRGSGPCLRSCSELWAKLKLKSGSPASLFLVPSHWPFCLHLFGLMCACTWGRLWKMQQVSTYGSRKPFEHSLPLPFVWSHWTIPSVGYSQGSEESTSLLLLLHLSPLSRAPGTSGFLYPKELKARQIFFSTRCFWGIED